MQIAILTLAIGTIIAIVLFYCAYMGFKAGLSLGMTANKGEVPVVKSPVQAFIDMRETQHIRKEMEKQAEEWAEMEQYDGWTEEERKMNSKGVVE